MTRVAVACFVLGVIVMVGFEHTVTLALGVALLFAFIVCGVFAIADPEILAAEDDEAA